MKRTGRNPWLIGAAMLATVLALAFLLPGCGQNPVSSIPDDPSGHGGGVRGLDYAGSFLHSKGTVNSAAVVPHVSSDTVVQVVDDKGGVLHLTLGSHPSTLQVLNGALPGPLTLSAVGMEVPTPWGTVDLYDFGPDGTVFAKPARLMLRTDLPDGATLNLFWWNPATRNWELQRATKVTGHSVTFDVFHFSKYGIG